jgi:hypothetical protein
VELSQRKRDRRLMRELLDAVAKVPLSDAQIAQVRAALLEDGRNVVLRMWTTGTDEPLRSEAYEGRRH